ncbi:MAG: 4Fe-4S dicluster domain-containing protein [Myxococcota bacterium]
MSDEARGGKSAAPPAAPGAPRAAEEPKASARRHARWGMVIDLGRCTACQGCVTACHQENNVPPSNPELAAERRSIRWIDLMPVMEGEYPHVRLSILPVTCMQCEKPPCIKVCPVGATFLSEEEGIVGQVYSRCIGCRYCTNACPYTVRQFNWFDPNLPATYRDGANPDVSLRYKGVVEKCTFCNHRLQKARDAAAAAGRELLPGEYTPACVEACPTRAMVFGDLADPESEVSNLARSKRAFRLMEDLGTEPKIYYLREGVRE